MAILERQILWSNSKFKWFDFTAPNKEDLESVWLQMSLEAAPNHLNSANLPLLSQDSILQCLHPDFLPLFENMGAYKKVILRWPESDLNQRLGSVQDLTTKLVLFYNEKEMITLHRLSLPVLERLMIDLNKKNKVEIESISPLNLVHRLFEFNAKSLDQPVNELEKRVDLLEHKIFTSQRSKALLLEGYQLKRMSSALKKIVKFTLDALTQLEIAEVQQKSIFKSAHSELVRLQFYAEDIYENIQSLLNIHLSIASQRVNEASLRTNEIMRIFTILTIFFLPLNFIVGLFGMNFDSIPLLNHEFGFWISVVIMIVTTSLMLGYLRVKGWLGSSRNSN